MHKSYITIQVTTLKYILAKSKPGFLEKVYFCVFTAFFKKCRLRRLCGELFVNND